MTLLIFCRSGELSTEYETKKTQMTKTEQETNFSLNKKKVNTESTFCSTLLAQFSKV